MDSTAPPATTPVSENTPKNKRSAGRLIFTVLLIYCIGHTLYTRKFSDVLDFAIIYPGIIGVFIFLIVSAYRHLVGKVKFELVDFLAGLIFAMPIMTLAISIGLYSSFIAGKDLLFWSLDPTTLSWRAAVAAAMVLAIGGSLFLFRLRFRCLYGMSEAAAGVAVALQRVMSARSTSDILSADVLFILLTASIYLIVRGFDNIHQGLSKDPIDPIATRFVAWLREKPQRVPRVH